MKHLTPLLCLSLGLACAGTTTAQDVYVIYSSKTKSLMKELQKSMSGREVKTFNANLLAVSDYSGKQKALSKFECAKVVVVLGVTAAKPLSNTAFSRPVVLVSAPGAKIASQAALMHVVVKGAHLPAGVKAEPVDKASDIEATHRCVVVDGKLALDAAVTRACDVLK